MSWLAWSARPHFRGSVHHRLDDLVVPGAAAEIARQPVADLGLGRVGIPLEQGLRGDEEARRADAALERGVLEELLLEGMERLAGGHALDGLDRPPGHLAAEDEARADEAPVERDAARPAVARGAALLAAGQVERVAEHVEQRLLRLAEELHRVPVHRRRHVVLGHQRALARSSAISAARRASTPATSMRNSTVPRLSSMGRHAARAAASSRPWAARSSLEPTMAWAAPGTSSTFSATAPSDTRARVIVPAPSAVRLTPAPTTAMSISVRGMKRRYASPEPFARGGKRKETTSSPLSRESFRGPIITSSTGTSRRPRSPATEATAPAAISSGSRTSKRIWTRRSVPPASTRASPRAPASRATAVSSDSGASYRMVVTSRSCSRIDWGRTVESTRAVAPARPGDRFACSPGCRRSRAMSTGRSHPHSLIDRA